MSNFRRYDLTLIDFDKISACDLYDGELRLIIDGQIFATDVHPQRVFDDFLAWLKEQKEKTNIRDMS